MPTPLEVAADNLNKAIDALRSHLDPRSGGGKEGDTESRRLADAINKLRGAMDIAYAKSVGTGTPAVLSPSEKGFVAAVEKSTKAMNDEMRARQGVERGLSSMQYAIQGAMQSIVAGDFKQAGAQFINAAEASEKINVKQAAALQIALAAAGKMVDWAREEAMTRTQEQWRGLAMIAPGTAQTMQGSKDLYAMAESERVGRFGEAEARARMDQLRAVANRAGMGLEHDPESMTRDWGSLLTRVRGWGTYYGARMPRWAGGLGKNIGEAEEMQQKMYQRHLEERMRQQGVELPEHLKEGKMLRDIVIPGLQSGVMGGGATSGALEYQAQLQVGGLHREEVQNQKMQEMLNKLEEIHQAIQGVKVNTGEMSGFSPF